MDRRSHPIRRTADAARAHGHTKLQLLVRRSNALQDWAYGRCFRYREVTDFGAGILGRCKALGMGGGMVALTAGLALPPSRLVLDRVTLRSKSKNTPFDGARMEGRVLATWVGGAEVFRARR